LSNYGFVFIAPALVEGERERDIRRSKTRNEDIWRASSPTTKKLLKGKG